MLTSVWEGSDGGLLSNILEFYGPFYKILDATYNSGKMWRGSGRLPDVTMDIDPRWEVDIHCDNQDMPTRLNRMFDLVVYDPPHYMNGGNDAEDKRYGVALKGKQYTTAFLYPGFIKSALRVLVPGGLIVAKLTDCVHNHVHYPNHATFIKCAEDAGFQFRDLIVKVRKKPTLPGRWKNQHHARKRHSYFILMSSPK